MRLELIWIYDGLVAEVGRATRINRPQQWSAWLLRRGSVRLKAGEREWQGGVGDWVITTGEPAWQEFADASEILSLQFEFAPPGAAAGGVEGGPCAVFRASDRPSLERQALRLLATARRYAGAGASPLQLWQAPTRYRDSLVIRAEFLRWFAALIDPLAAVGLKCTPAVPADDRVRIACDLLNSAPLSAPFPRRQLVQACGLSAVHLDRVFLNETGVTPRRYFDNRRFLLARSAIEREPASVKELAYRLGFSQVSHFSTWFKRWSGSAPSRFRPER